jgi:hypothetical protein
MDAAHLIELTHNARFLDAKVAIFTRGIEPASCPA